jgi:hypothetical protein
MASLWTNKAAFLVMSGQLDLDAATGLKFMLLQSSLTPLRTHNFISDIVSAECSVTGYTGGFGGAGRKTLASKTVTEDDTNHRGVFDAADPSQYTLGAGNTLRHGAIVEEKTSDADSPVLFFLDMGADKVTNGGTMDFQFSSNGIAYIQC